VALREAGRTREQIRRELGLGSEWAVTRLLDREPARHQGLRARAKDEKRRRARALRLAGNTYPEIAAALGVSKSSISLWTRGLPPLSEPPLRRTKRVAGIRATLGARREERDVERRRTKEAARRQIGALSDRELLIAGALIYWCEGGKDKGGTAPGRRHQEYVSFINSDPGLILLFLRFLAVAGADPATVRYRVHIHETADLEAAMRYWMGLVGAERAAFDKPNIKRHKPKTLRTNVGDDYQGCLQIRLRQSVDLYRKIEGWARAAMPGSAPER